MHSKTLLNEQIKKVSYKIIQKAKIVVNKEGTEAAAAKDYKKKQSDSFLKRTILSQKV